MLSVSFSVLLSFSLLVSTTSSLSTSKSPGGNFDLTHYYLTLPDDDVSDISADDLEDGYEDKYFYTDSSDGAMTFYVPKDGGTTSGSSYPRAELREQCLPGNNEYNWDLTSGTHQINGQYEIGSSTTATYFIIQQIHNKNGPGKPLLKIRYNNGMLRAEIKSNSAGSSEVKTEMATVAKGEKFWLKVQVNNGYVKTYLNGVRYTNTYVADYWGDYLNFFKTGCYKTQDEDDNVKAYVKVHSLTVSHSDSSLCYHVDDAFTLSGDTNGGNGNGATIAIVIIVLFVLSLCGVAGGYYYKKKYLQSKSDNNNNNNNKVSGDTPIVGNEDGVANNAETKTGGYDMDEIEINVDAEINS